MLQGKMRKTTVPEAVDLRGKASIPEKENHLKQTSDEKAVIQ